MKRLMLALLLLTAASFSSCASAFPHTQKVLEPNTFEDLFIGIAADVELWIEFYGLHGVAGFLMFL